jgi:hypothetical protein
MEGVRISLDKQVQIYSVDTSYFYNEFEEKIHRRLSKAYQYKNHLKGLLDKDYELNYKNKIEQYLAYNNKRIKHLKDKMRCAFQQNKDIRTLNHNLIGKKNIISVFDSVLTRTLGIKQDTLSEDLIVVQTYYFDILEDIILNGFIYKGEKYVVFTASAGQIRTKKTLFIKESVWQKYQNTLTCGLSVDNINSQGGVNINKYLAYLALCNSATDEWKDFDINKAIVVDDMETAVRSLVDFIDDKTYEISRQEMDIVINHTDGCGMILPRRSKKSMMVRLPWIKGLLIPFPFDKFIREANKKSGSNKYGIVTDIYGKQHNLLKDGIEIIFTKSQFKMWKYYRDWQHYKENYIKYGCQAGKCNEEEDIFADAKLNYQMLQTLVDMTDEELLTLSERTRNDILNIGRDKKTMLKVLGVVDSNTRKNYLQQALEIYPELLNDTYSREILKNVKRSMVKEARAGKIEIHGKYTFICPDLYAFCQWLILGDKNPDGLLANGEVSCKLYKDKPKLDCLRSPHLYLEHAIRKNVVNKETNRWFITNGLYTSIHDPISKILMFDVDGDKSLVCADETLINVAERNMKDIVPLYYNMAIAGKDLISNQSIYNGLKAAYKGGNIGVISNNITKIWNSDDINLNVIKWLCMENNFVIDYAKTLYKVKRPKEIGKLITKYTKNKVPHFFIYAKDKKKNQVEKINNSTVNRLEYLIPNKPLNFSAAGIGKFDYRMLMSNPDVEVIQEIVDLYSELDLNKRFIDIDPSDRNSTEDNLFVYRDIRNKLLNIEPDIYKLVDVLVKYLYNYKKSNYKTTLWSSFGDILVENLNRNLQRKYGEKTIQCEICSIRIEVTGNRRKYCEKCWREKQKEWQRESMKKARRKTKCEVLENRCNS